MAKRASHASHRLPTLANWPIVRPKARFFFKERDPLIEKVPMDSVRIVAALAVRQSKKLETIQLENSLA